ncbi:MAG: serine hydrolase domain-containing protein [bacterium]
MPPICSVTNQQTSPWRAVLPHASSAWSALLLAGACATHQPTVKHDSALAATVETVSRQAMTTYKLKSMIVRVTLDGSDVFTGAFGESMTGVPATPAMRFRNGAFAYSYLGYITAQLAAADVFSLDDTIDRWLPELPRADQVTVGDLPHGTSGYSDYVYSDEVGNAVSLEPFRQWSTDELIRIGVNGPQQFAPGTNWGYSHTNFSVLAQVLEKATGKTLHQLMDTYVFEPMRLSATGDNGDTPAIPEPVQHSFTSERRTTLQVPAAIPFYEDSTYWNPSWTAPAGAVQTSNIFDVATSIEMIGSGALISPEAHALQVAKQRIGSKDPSCAACRPLTEEFSYGMGVELQKDWIVQTKEFVGSYVTGGYLPAKKLTIAVAVTVLPEAFDAEGNPQLPQVIRSVFRALAVPLGGAATLPAPPPG